MRRTRNSIVAAAGIAAASVALIAGCFSERTHGGPTGPVSGDCRIPIDSPIIGSTGALVAIRNFTFSPATVRVKPGTTVTWINCEPEGIDAHTSTSDDAMWDSPFLEPGAMYSYTFAAPGTYDYHCLPHPFMQGVVIVE